MAESVAKNRFTTLVPAVAVIVPPPQEPVNPLGVATISPLGSVSGRERLVSGTGLGLVIVKVKVEVWPATIVEGEKLLLGIGCCGGVTVMLAEAVGPTLVSFVNMVAVVLVSFPSTGGLLVVTFTE